MRIILFLAICIAGVSARPTFLWYGTYSIENYVGNGCDASKNRYFTHEAAQGFAAAMQSPNREFGNVAVLHNQNFTDAACTADKWSGSYTGVNENDFVFYAGHGNETEGPNFGCNPTYDLNVPQLSRLGEGYLRWLQMHACMTLGQVYPLSYWAPAFRGIHSIMGHHNNIYDAVPNLTLNMSEDFWRHWNIEGYSIKNSWFIAQRDWLHDRPTPRYIEPAILAAPGNYANETWEQATNAPAPYGTGVLSWVCFGTPQMP